MLETLTRLRALAQDSVPPEVWDYVCLGERDGPNDWSRHRLLPHVLRDVGRVDTSTVLLGRPARSPVLVAPTGYHTLVHADGEVASAAGARAAGAVYIASTRSGRRYADLGTADDSWWLQVYLMRDRGLTRALVAAAVAAGACALVVTGDTPYLGRQARFSAPLATRSAHSTNLDVDLRTLPADATTQDPSATVDDAAQLAAEFAIPFLVKGVLRADDARECVDAGAAGIVVSNHGRRQLANAVDTASALPRVVESVGDRAEVYVDGDIRDGTAVLTALALGARGVCVGRPVLWGLAAEGAHGVQAALDALVEDLRLAMALSGVTDVGQIRADLVGQIIGTEPDRFGR